MPTSRVLSLYYTEREMNDWKAYAASNGLVRADGTPRIAQAIRELAAQGLDASNTFGSSNQLKAFYDLLLNTTLETAAGVRLLLLNADNADELGLRLRASSK